jgi:UDP-glucose 4-epimerase
MTIDRYNDLLNNNAGTQESTLLMETEITPKSEISNKKILVTGGAGYIGAHAARELLKSGYEVVIIDNLSSGKQQNVPQGAKFIEGDLSDVNLLRDVFAAENFFAVMHFAASIEVEESVTFPQKYLENNVLNTAILLSVMNDANVKRIIFSSTAAVYGEQEIVPISENAKLSPNNPYGYSKLLAERLIKYYSHFMGFKTIVFRYFNACGCDFDGGIAATHQTHLIPIVLDVALGHKPFVKVYGTDYKTHDGTAVRDYVHVLDIAAAHVLALEKLESLENYRIYNIGTGRGSSVREVINKASEIINKIIPMEMSERRPGDAEITVADNSKIKQELGFELRHSDLDTIISTSWTQMNKNK